MKRSVSDKKVFVRLWTSDSKPDAASDAVVEFKGVYLKLVLEDVQAMEEVGEDEFT